MQTRCVIIITVISALFFAASAHAERRVALVVGNSAYTNISPLDNPKNDAELIARTLQELGFEVVTALDADRKTLGRAIRKFGKALRTAGNDAAGLFYYAGHGVQARGENYLVPLGALIEDEADLDIEAVSASDVLNQMESAGNALNIVVLDACRNNPFKGKVRSTLRGLARVPAASGSLVAFAAAPGQVASDGSVTNSPYTAALAKAMREPGLTVEQVFKRVRVSVESETGGAQTPWEESSLRGDFYFVPAATSVQTTGPSSTPSPRTSGFDERAVELSFWDSIKNSKNAAAFEEYIRRWPDGAFSFLAKLRLENLKKNVASLQPSDDGSPEKAALNEGGTSTEAMTRKLQTELKRVGCDPGSVDGRWGRKGKAALVQFNRHANTNLPTGSPSKSAIQTIESRRTRVCPKVAKAAPPHDQPANTETTTARPFDGTWRVSKSAPACPNKSSTFTLSIVGGKAHWGGGSAALSANGSIRLTTRPKKSRVGTVQGTFAGRLKGNSGGGRFTGRNLSNGRTCAGSFKMTRISR